MQAIFSMSSLYTKMGYFFQKILLYENLWRSIIKNIYDAHTAFGASKFKVQSSKSENGNPFSASSRDDTSDFVLSETLEEAKKRNETAESRVIGMAIETRPDWIDEEEIIRLRRYGVTRVEIGYQTTHDEINELNKR